MTPILHHVGIVVPSVEDAQATMAALGLVEDYRGYVPEFFALCIFTRATASAPIEFVVPDGGPLLKFNRGMGGMHHLAYVTDDLDRLAHDLAAKGIPMLVTPHVKGAGDFLCNFVSPIYTRGITVEYVQLLTPAR